ncbi:MAG: helix-turn-helix transcriptional regulator [Gemmatimonadetes bacterium]|nr:helix-turn-helix transcriptional regulator [Gemmatimonadota bacterium]
MPTLQKPVAAQIARWCHALSDPTRVRVLELLSDGEHCVCDLQEALTAAQSRLSFHLRVLREAGIVSDRKEGRWVHYSLRPEALEQLAAYLHARMPDPDAPGACNCGNDRASDCC